MNEYAGFIREIIDRYRSQKGFLDCESVTEVSQEIQSYLAIAELHLDCENENQAILLAEAIISELAEAILNSDSDGNLEADLDQAVNLLSMISHSAPPASVRNHLYECCLRLFEKEQVRSLGQEVEILEFIANMKITVAQARQALKVMGKYKDCQAGKINDFDKIRLRLDDISNSYQDNG